MGKVIRLPGDRCQDAQLLLPWYVTGRLEADERARVAAHLETCAKCRADLQLEQRLEAEVGALPLDIERGWEAMRRRVAEAETPRGPFAAARGAAVRAWRTPWLGWTAAAGVAIVALLAVPAQKAAAPEPPARFHALSSPTPSPPADVLVVFRPEARAADIAQVLRASGAQIAEGPNGADAFALRVARPQREAALKALRASSAVALAEPIAGDTP